MQWTTAKTWFVIKLAIAIALFVAFLTTGTFMRFVFLVAFLGFAGVWAFGELQRRNWI